MSNTQVQPVVLDLSATPPTLPHTGGVVVLEATVLDRALLRVTDSGGLEVTLPQATPGGNVTYRERIVIGPNVEAHTVNVELGFYPQGLLREFAKILTIPVGSEPPPAPMAPSAPGQWGLIFSEDFNGAALPPGWLTSWFWSPGGCSNGSGEGEWYLPENVVLGNGYLSLVAKRQTVTNVSSPGDSTHTYNYTSGMVNSEGGFQFLYGYVEWVARLPVGQGFWPALWLLPINNTDPPEIDVLEVVGKNPDVWTGTNLPSGAAAQGRDTTIPGLSSGWHTFAADWEPGSVTWYVDGKQVANATSPGTCATPMYLIMNFAVGGAWPGFPDATTPFPSSFDISSVRVWQHSSATVGTPNVSGNAFALKAE